MAWCWCGDGDDTTVDEAATIERRTGLAAEAAATRTDRPGSRIRACSPGIEDMTVNARTVWSIAALLISLNLPNEVAAAGGPARRVQTRSAEASPGPDSGLCPVVVATFSRARCTRWPTWAHGRLPMSSTSPSFLTSAGTAALAFYLTANIDRPVSGATRDASCIGWWRDGVCGIGSRNSDRQSHYPLAAERDRVCDRSPWLGRRPDSVRSIGGPRRPIMRRTAWKSCRRVVKR